MCRAQVIDVKPYVFGEAITDQVLILELVFAHEHHVPVLSNRVSATIGRNWDNFEFASLPKQRRTVLIQLAFSNRWGVVKLHCGSVPGTKRFDTVVSQVTNNIEYNSMPSCTYY